MCETTNRDRAIRHYRYGAPFTVPVGAPNPDLYIKGWKEDENAANIFAGKTERREAAIRNLIDTTNCEFFEAAMKYDIDLCPKTTNKKQLTELNCFVPSSVDDVDESLIHLTLWRIIYNLARMGVFVTGTNTFTDRDLLDRLVSTVLVDEISDIPPSPDLSEFVDLSHDRSDCVELVERDQILPKPDRTPLDDYSGA